jgi:hypothetical protein
MVIREYCECKVCGQILCIRAGVGLEAKCQHQFDCPNCHSPIVLFVCIGTPPAAWIEFQENSSKVQYKEDAAVINLHPSIAFESEDYHSPIVFASMKLTKLVAPYMRVPDDSRTRDVAQDFELPETKQLWEIVRNVLRLYQVGDPAGVISSQIARYQANRQKYHKWFRCSTVFKCVASFFDDLMYPAIGNLRQPLRVLISDLRRDNLAELNKFQAYYRLELEKESLARFLSLFDDYISNFDQFRQLYVHARVGDDNVDGLIVGAKSFEKVKLFYGQAYETLTSAYVTLACLNNIKQGRPYDVFQSMTLTKYIKDLDKSKKSNAFLVEPCLASFSKWDDSALRNGSHHASIVREGEKVKYRSGGTGAEREITYARYLHVCNGIAIACAALMLVELQEFSSMAP